MRHVQVLEPSDLLVTQRERLGSERVLDVGELRGPDDRRRHSWLVQEPREGDLCRRDSPFRRDLGNTLDDRDVEVRPIQGVGEGIRPSACRQPLAGGGSAARK